MQYLTLEGFLPPPRGRSRRLALDRIRIRQAAYAEDLALDLAILQGRRVLKREPWYSCRESPKTAHSLTVALRTVSSRQRTNHAVLPSFHGRRECYWATIWSKER